ncbi:MAG: type II toxin-antitoxin system RelE/ParE family toxin [Amphritea sp.]|nr:type II toxin-antitoxin system RelE/ParE family toxin [Amphritea sp.]
MSGEQSGTEIEVFSTRVFDKALDKLDDETLALVEDEIDKVVEDPTIGIQKKGDLNYLWVHKFKVEGRELLLGYSWQENELHLYLLNIGPHENFYTKLKQRRKADLKIMK